MVKISVFLLLALIATACYCIGLLYFLSDIGEDKCEMTFMFEYPQFVRISNKIDKKYPKYELYAYSEGRFTSKVRNMDFTGIPVLFIPGNAGSYRQVRSLASVALRKALSEEVPFHFDYFTVDLNNEHSGLYGPLLYEHLEYVNASFYRIFELYTGVRSPKSIIIIGHSMGGVVAKYLCSQMLDSTLVPILITLAAPLQRAPVIFDYHFEWFYEKAVQPVSNSTTMVSLSGGYRDFLILPFLSRLKSPAIYAVTSSVPLSWIECNHVQILWCKQIILALTRALFDSVNLKTRQVSLNSTYRNIVFNHHLVRHSGIKMKHVDSYFQLTGISYKGKWIENIMKQYSIELSKGISEPHWYMVKMTSLPGYEILNILALNLELVDWIYVCNANMPMGSARVCVEAVPLTHLSEIIPSIKYKRRYFQMNLQELRGNYSDMTHVVFRALPTRKPLVFHVDVHGAGERDITVDLPKWWSFQKHILIETTADKAVYYRMLLPQIHHVIYFYQLFVEPLKCSNEDHHATAVLVTPWTDEKSQAFFTKSDRNPLNLRLHSSRTPTDMIHPFVRLTLDPSCTYRLSVKNSFFGMLGQMARLYTPLLLTYISVVVLMSLRYQLRSLRSGYFPIIFSAIKNGAKPYYVVTISRFCTQILQSKIPSWMPAPDNWYLIEDGIDFFLLPVLLYMSAVGIVWMASLVYGISLFTLESTFNKLVLKVLNRTFIWSNYIVKVLHKVPFVVASFLILISITTCGSLALCLGSIFYFLKLTQMSQDYVEDVVWFIVKKFLRKLKGALKKQPKRKIRDGDSVGNKVIEVAATSDATVKDNEGNMLTNDADEVSDHEEKCDEKTKKDKLESAQDETTALSDNLKKTDIETVSNNEDSENRNNKSKSEESENEPASEPSNSSSPMMTMFNPIFFHTTMFFLWVIITIIHLPAVLTWAHNFNYNKALIPDDSFVSGLSLSICALALWQFEFPKVNRIWLDTLDTIILLVIILSMVFATVSIYRLSYLLTFVFVLVVLHQSFAPSVEGSSSEEEDDHKNSPKDKFDEIKMKLD